MSTEDLDRAIAGFRRFAEAMEEARRQAFEADPTLEARLSRARMRDPDIGWLDVAARRERGGANKTDRRGV